MKKEKRYVPLKYADELDGISAFSLMKEHELIPESTTPSEYLDFVLSPDFLDAGYKGTFSKLNQYALKNARNLSGDLPEMLISPAQARTEIQDVMGTEAMVRNWLEYKRVYTFDKDFFRELLQTEKIGVPKGLLSNLPYDCFYLDFQKVQEFVEPFVGAFVKMANTDRGEQLAVYMVTEKLVTFSYYTQLFYGSDGIADLLLTSPSVPMIARELGTRNSVQVSDIDNRIRVVNAVMQTVLFLSAGNTDQKLSQRPRTQSPGIHRHRHNYSDMEIWDVGIQYGTAIRAARKECESRKEECIHSLGKERKSPRPHIRCAHWQRYHIGEGRQEIRINWVLPAFVGSKNIPVMIQEIRKGEN